VLLICVVVAAAGCLSGKRASDRRVVIVSTADEQGEIHDCGCAEQPSGGLARRVAYLQSLRRDGAPGNLPVVVEAGDFLAGDAPRNDEERAAAVERARLIATAYRAAGCDAVLFGKRDLALGLPLLRELAAAIHAPVLGANLLATDGGAPFGSQSTIIERHGVRLGLLGLIAPPTPAEVKDGFALPRDLALLSPAETAARLVPDLRKAVDVVVLVANMDRATLAKVLAAAKGVDFVLQSGEATTIAQRVDTARGAAIVSLYRGGRFAGRLDLTLVKPGKPFSGFDDRQILERKIQRYREYLDALAREAGGADKIPAHFAGQPDVLANARRFGEDIALWTKEMNELREKGNRYAFDLVELSPAFGLDSDAAAAVAAFDKAHPAPAPRPK
jgi:2',3'-cyclic-nucleotide 2'-phosphodiesterase (5'-nucleotidase family)